MLSTLWMINFFLFVVDYIFCLCITLLSWRLNVFMNTVLIYTTTGSAFEVLLIVDYETIHNT